jgi:hypothetical protein
MTTPTIQKAALHDHVAFASDLRWSPGYFPPALVVTSVNGRTHYTRVSLTPERAVYKHPYAPAVTIFND